VPVTCTLGDGLAIAVGNKSSVVKWNSKEMACWAANLNSFDFMSV
jgi:hypothetical protein